MISIKDHYGRVKAAWSFMKTGLSEPTAVEATTLFHGVNLCTDLGN